MDTPKQDPRAMVASTIGVELLQAVVQEVRLLPDVWPKLPKAKQDDVIDRLRARVETNVKMAVHLLAANGRTVVAGDLEQITIKDGVKAVVKFGPNAANLHELYDVAGKAVLLAVANAADYTGGMEQVRGESDQRAMDLGHEYKPNSDGEGMGNDDNIVDAEIKELPAPALDPEELRSYFRAGYSAAMKGQGQDSCPVVASELVIAWIRGWEAWNEPVPTAKLDELPNEHGVYTCDADEVIEWVKQKHSVIIDLLELENGKWLYATELNNIDGQYRSSPLTACDSADSREGALIAIRRSLTQIYAKGHDCGLKGKVFSEFRDFVDGLVENHPAPGTDAEA